MEIIITHLLFIIKSQKQIISCLLTFIAKHIPLRQYAFDDSNSPKYQKFKTDKLPIIQHFVKQDYEFLLAYYKWKYGKILKPIKRRNGRTIPEDIFCPLCHATHHYIYDNNGAKGQFQCKICATTFSSGKNVSKPLKLKCPYCQHSLSPIKSRKFFVIHKCVNKKCSYYLNNLKKVPSKSHLEKTKYKLHYIYREFSVDFFKMDLSSLPTNSFSLKFRKNNAYIMSLCLTFHVNLGLSLRKTARALDDLYGIKISHTMVAKYCKTASIVIKPFTDNFDYDKSDTFVADETYINVKGRKGYIWFIMDAISRSIIGYRVSDNRSVGPCILAMRMAFNKMKSIRQNFAFIADGYSAYPLAAQQFSLREKNPLHFDITRVIGLTNDDPVSTKFRPFKQMVERLNRSFKASYRCTCGYDNFDGANYSVSLWVTYYNFLRKHQSFNYTTLNSIPELENADNMPAKWQILILLAQQYILEKTG